MEPLVAYCSSLELLVTVALGAAVVAYLGLVPGWAALPGALGLLAYGLLSPLAFGMVSGLRVAESEPSNAYRHGAEVAERDHATGRLRLLTFGFAADLPTHFYDVLAQDGIEARAGTGCILPPEPHAWVSGYNDVMMRYIAARFGEGYLLDRLGASRVAARLDTD